MKSLADAKAKGVRIYNKRRALGLSQRALAKQMNVSHVSVSHWESGKHVFEMSARNESELVRALRTNERWLNTGHGPDGPEGAMTDEEIALIELYRKLGPDERERLQDYAQFSAERSHPNENGPD